MVLSFMLYNIFIELIFSLPNLYYASLIYLTLLSQFFTSISVTYTVSLVVFTTSLLPHVVQPHSLSSHSLSLIIYQAQSCHYSLYHFSYHQRLPYLSSLY